MGTTMRYIHTALYCDILSIETQWLKVMETHLMHIERYACTYAVHTCLHTHTHTHKHTHTYTRIHAHMHAHAQADAQAHAHTHTHTKQKQSVSLPLSGHAIWHSQNARALSGPMSQCNATSWSWARNLQVD